MSIDDPPIYAASCRWITRGTRARLEAWSHTLVVGQPLPTLPLWLRDDLAIALALGESYEQACRDLWISDARSTDLHPPPPRHPQPRPERQHAPQPTEPRGAPQMVEFLS